MFLVDFNVFKEIQALRWLVYVPIVTHFTAAVHSQPVHNLAIMQEAYISLTECKFWDIEHILSRIRSSKITPSIIELHAKYYKILRTIEKCKNHCTV